MSNIDFRAKLTMKPANLSKIMSPDTRVGGMRSVLGPNETEDVRRNNILTPLYSTSGVVFPYRPTVQTGNTAKYEEITTTHSNYNQLAYNSSVPSELIVTAKFTAQTVSEAKYLLATIHFFRTVTKMYFANPTAKVGVPPPVLLFNYMGAQMFNNVPVVVKNFNFTLPDTVDYVKVSGSLDASDQAMWTSSMQDTTEVPSELEMTITLGEQYNPYKLSKEFDLDKFRTGQLLNKGYI
jgi:hypothetical protein